MLAETVRLYDKALLQLRTLLLRRSKAKHNSQNDQNEDKDAAQYLELGRFAFLPRQVGADGTGSITLAT